MTLAMTTALETSGGGGFHLFRGFDRELGGGGQDGHAHGDDRIDDESGERLLEEFLDFLRRAGEDAAHQVAQREERRREKSAALFVHPGKCLAEKLRVVFACSGAIVIAFDDGGEVLLEKGAVVLLGCVMHEEFRKRGKAGKEGFGSGVCQMELLEVFLCGGLVLQEMIDGGECA